MSTGQQGQNGPEEYIEAEGTTAPAILSSEAAANPLRSQQWHLDGYLTPGGNANGANIDAISLEYTGAGVKVGIVDEGFDLSNLDLAGRFNLSLSYDPRDSGTSNIRPDTAEQFHGTAVSGVIGASSDNAFGTVGVAADSDMVGYFARFGMGGSTRAELTDLLARQVNVDVSNNSWGYTGQFSDNFQTSAWFGMRNAIANSAAEGRDGLGTVYVFAAGNDRQYVQNSLSYDGDNTNYHNLTNNRFTITTAATTSTGVVAQFSTPGASILVAAPGQSVLTTARTNGDGDFSNDYGFVSGTSFAAPIVTGVVALMLEANPNLGYRDVQEILTLSSRKNDINSAAWAENGTSNWNGGANLVSHDVGFGLVDAHAAVRLAETWTMTHTAANEAVIALTGNLGGNTTLVDGQPNDYAVNVSAAYENFSIDWVEVDISLLHTHIGDLRIELVSPTGTHSVLLDRPSAGNNTRDNLTFTFSTTHDWGESPDGTWHVIVTDLGTGGTGSMVSFSVRIFGDDQGTDRTFYYTDQFATLTGDRDTLTGTAGIDTINAAAITTDLHLDLNAGAISTIAGRQVETDASTVVENAIGGDGDDTIIGNAADNQLSGGRGDDTLNGGDGNDQLFGGQGTDTLVGGIGDDTYIIDEISDVVIENANEGTDTIRTNIVNYVLPDHVENLMAWNGQLTGTSGLVALSDPSFTLIGNSLDNVITGGNGNDVISGMGGTDTLIGGLGDDVYYVVSNADIVIEDADGGYDAIIATFNYHAPANVEAVYITGGADTGYADATGSVLLGTAATGAVTFFGAQGNDVLVGSYFADSIYGGGGNDTIYAVDGNDVLQGGIGDDAYFLYQQGAVVEEDAGEGGDTVYAAFDYVLPENVEVLYTYGSATHGTGNDGDNVLVGFYASTGQHLDGGAGTDILIGSNFADVLIGGSSDDLLRGNLGADLLFGGTGNDVYIVDDAQTTIVEYAGEGADAIYSNVDYTMPDNCEALFLAGSATHATGGAGNDLIIAAYIATGAVLDGAAGNDYLIGSAGNDHITGGADADRLWGYGGNDLFVFRPGEALCDVLVDFEAGDQLQFSGFGPGAALTQLSATQWMITYGAEHEAFTLENGYQLRAGDYLFV